MAVGEDVEVSAIQDILSKVSAAKGDGKKAKKTIQFGEGRGASTERLKTVATIASSEVKENKEVSTHAVEIQNNAGFQLDVRNSANNKRHVWENNNNQGIRRGKANIGNGQPIWRTRDSAGVENQRQYVQPRQNESCQVCDTPNVTFKTCSNCAQLRNSLGNGRRGGQAKKIHLFHAVAG